MQTTTTQLFALGAAWIVYGALHSLLASTRCKRFVASRWPRLAPNFRLAYNVIAVITLVPPLWMMYEFNGEPLWQWRGAWAWLANMLASLAITGFIWSTRYYDMPQFIGVRRSGRGFAPMAEQGFVISPLHRVVRHPWYFLALVVLWTRDMDAARLVSTIAITCYFALGSYWEEQKLVLLHGDRYRAYRRCVPGLVPLPWKFLRTAEAKRLVRDT
jgi:protein-S-isoprenylcysteine O-methyltransferase Ste14